MARHVPFGTAGNGNARIASAYHQSRTALRRIGSFRAARSYRRVLGLFVEHVLAPRLIADHWDRVASGMASVPLRKRPIDVRTGEGRLKEPTATKIRNGGFPQYRDVTQAGNHPASRATSTVESATRQRAEFVALPGSLARSRGRRGRAQWCRPRRLRLPRRRLAALQQDQGWHGSVCGLGPAALRAVLHRPPAPEAPALPSPCPRRHEMLEHPRGGRRSTAGDRRQAPQLHRERKARSSCARPSTPGDVPCSRGYKRATPWSSSACQAAFWLRGRG